MMVIEQKKTRSPHFDDDRVIWKDEYSGLYEPVDYSIQFDYEWKLFGEKKIGFCSHTGVETDDPWIDDRIYELTGVKNFIERKKIGAAAFYAKKLLDFFIPEEQRNIGGRLYLDPKFSIDHFDGKRCLDIGCGAGRWTKTLLTLGATVKSIDVSEHGLKSTRRFNDDVEALSIFDIKTRRKDLHSAFDFVICWGVVMCTHDPKEAFENAAIAVKRGGQLYTMIYAPTYHNSPDILAKRKHYHTQLSTLEEKLQYAYDISDCPENAINNLDMLNTFYNWTVPEETIHNWYKTNGLESVVTLNAHENPKCAYHVLGTKK